MRYWIAVLACAACANAFAEPGDHVVPTLYATVHFGGPARTFAEPRAGLRLDYASRPESAPLSMQALSTRPALMQWELGVGDSTLKVAGLQFATIDVASHADDSGDSRGARIAKAVTITAVAVYASEAVAALVVAYALKHAFDDEPDGDDDDAGSSSPGSGGTASGSGGDPDGCSGVLVNGTCVGGS